jgi:Lsr2
VPPEHPDAVRLTFGIPPGSCKTAYEIDLSNDHAAELRETLARYVNAARKRRASGARP